MMKVIRHSGLATSVNFPLIEIHSLDDTASPIGNNNPALLMQMAYIAAQEVMEKGDHQRHQLSIYRLQFHGKKEVYMLTSAAIMRM